MDARGYTLLELLTTIAIAAILAAVGAPALSDFRLSQQIDAELSVVARQWSASRAHAMHNRANVLWCGLDRNGTCSISDAIEFAYFEDLDGDRRLSQGDVVLERSRRQFPGKLESEYANRGYLRFRKRTGAMESGHFRVCNGDRGKQLVVYRTGRIRREAISASVCRATP